MKPLWQSREQAEDTTERLRKFGQPLRLMILSLLLQREKSVGEIDMATGIAQPGLRHSASNSPNCVAQNS